MAEEITNSTFPFSIYGKVEYDTYSNSRNYLLFCSYCKGKVGHKLILKNPLEISEINLKSMLVAMKCLSCGNSSIWIIKYEKEGKHFSGFEYTQQELINKNLIGTIISDKDIYYPIKDEFCIYPSEITDVEQPVKCMPENIKDVYKEAASIVNKSPRAAATLLRLSLQSLLEIINDNKRLKSIWDAINNQLDSNTPKFIKDIMNIIRKEGNNSAHDADYKELGYINTKDDNSKAMKDAKALFHYINVICEYVIGFNDSMEQFKNDFN